MHEKLMRWSELEPERIYIIEGRCGDGKWGITYERSTYTVALGHDVNELTDGASEKIEYDIQDDGAIIVAVQEAIEAKGWYIGLHSAMSGQGPLYEAFVHTSNGYVGSTPAVVLLSAYLAALEAQ